MSGSGTTTSDPGTCYPSTGDVEITAASEVTAVDFAWTPSHIRRSEEVTLVDSTRVERITFLRTANEVVTAVDGTDRLFLLVGNDAVYTLPGWNAEDFKKSIHKRLLPGESYSFIVEDHLTHRTLSDASLWIQNTEAHKLSALVTENIVIEGGLDTFKLYDGALLEAHVVEPFVFPQLVTLPERTVYHEVTVTNDETERESYVIFLIAGWIAQCTNLPAELPCVFGEGLQR